MPQTLNDIMFKICRMPSGAMDEKKKHSINECAPLRFFFSLFDGRARVLMKQKHRMRIKVTRKFIYLTGATHQMLNHVSPLTPHRQIQVNQKCTDDRPTEKKNGILFNARRRRCRRCSMIVVVVVVVVVEPRLALEISM